MDNDDTEVKPNDLKKKSKKKLYFFAIILGLVALIIIGLLATLLGSDDKTVKIVKKPVTPKIFYKIRKAFVVQFDQRKRYKFITINISLSIKSKESIPLLDDNLLMLRHNYINIISQHSMLSLSNATGRTELKQQLKQAANNILAMQGSSIKTPVKNVLFTAFFIQ